MSSKQAILFPAIVVATLSANFSAACFAQGFMQSVAIRPGEVQESKAEPQWTDSTRIKIKPEMRQEFEGCLKRLIAAYRKAGIPWFLTFETFAGDAAEYTTVAPVRKFGDLDGPSPELMALGAAEWKRLSRSMARCYTAVTRIYATPHTELEIDKAEAPMGLYWVETTVQVVPGKMGDYLNWLGDDYRPALLKAGVARFRVSQPVFGAASSEIVIARMLESLAEIDKGSVLSKALGDEETRALTATSVPLVNSSTTRIIRIRTDLGYSAEK